MLKNIFSGSLVLGLFLFLGAGQLPAASAGSDHRSAPVFESVIGDFGDYIYIKSPDVGFNRFGRRSLLLEAQIRRIQFDRAHLVAAEVCLNQQQPESVSNRLVLIAVSDVIDCWQASLGLDRLLLAQFDRPVEVELDYIVPFGRVNFVVAGALGSGSDIGVSNLAVGPNQGEASVANHDPEIKPTKNQSESRWFDRWYYGAVGVILLWSGWRLMVVGKVWPGKTDDGPTTKSKPTPKPEKKSD